MIEEAKAIRLKISLVGSDPLIWRRIVVDSRNTFHDLDIILQIAMGWESIHHYNFKVDNYHITTHDEAFNDIGPEDSKSIDAQDLTLHDALLRSGVKNFLYEYDLGDGWIHNIQIESVKELEEEYYPICLDGEMSCPPEDCGGIPGYYRMLKILDNKLHPEHESMKDWLGRDFDPEFFSTEEVNMLFALHLGEEEKFQDNEFDEYQLEKLAEKMTFSGTLEMNIVNISPHPLPKYESESSAGMDLRAFIEGKITLKPLERTVVKTGLFIELPHGYEAQIRPRSGLAAKHGITVLNAPGTIDADYRGEIGVILVNLSNEAYTIEDGDRIAQMVISHHCRALWNETDELGSTRRGEGGFGSTGKS